MSEWREGRYVRVLEPDEDPDQLAEQHAREYEQQLARWRGEDDDG